MLMFRISVHLQQKFLTYKFRSNLHVAGRQVLYFQHQNFLTGLRPSVDSDQLTRLCTVLRPILLVPRAVFLLASRHTLSWSSAAAAGPFSVVVWMTFLSTSRHVSFLRCCQLRLNFSLRPSSAGWMIRLTVGLCVSLLFRCILVFAGDHVVIL